MRTNSEHSFGNIKHQSGSSANPCIGTGTFRVRRRLIAGALFGSLLAFVSRAHGQPPQKSVRIGVMAGKSDSAYRPSFVRVMGDLGWTEGKNLTVDWHQIDRPEDIAAQAADLIQQRPDVIVTAGPRITQEIARLTTTIPIAFIGVADPISLRLVRSLPFPGGNLTGFLTSTGPDYLGKLMQLLQEAAPGTARIGMLIAAGNDLHRGTANSANSFAQQLKASVTVLSVSNADEIQGAFVAATRHGVQALFVPGDVLFSANRERIAALALKNRLPSIFMFPYYVDAGGLLSYGISVDAVYRSVAGIVNKILSGARPQDIPVEQPTRFEMVINLKTARALGLKVSQSVLLRADRMIE